MPSAEALSITPATTHRRLYDKLVDRYHARVYDYLCWLCRDEGLAADLTAETFLQVWRHPPDPGRQTPERAYVLRIALNQYRQHLRRPAVGTVHADEALEGLADAADPPPVALEREELRRGVRWAVERLPEAYREVVLLHSLQGLSLTEAAEALEIPVGTAKSRLAAAFAILRQSLAAWKEQGDEVR